MDGRIWLDEAIVEYRSHKGQCEGAVVQVSDDEFLAIPGPHSIAILMKHIGGNLRSRWRDFLTTDGEKRDRNRESEFSAEGETRTSILDRWEEGWSIAFASLGALQPADLERTITIRGQPHPVTQAIHRNLCHVAYHAGHIVLLARTFAGENWQTLSVAPGKSEEHNAAMRAKYGDWWAKESG
jgi:hypothetical protein